MNGDVIDVPADDERQGDRAAPVHHLALGAPTALDWAAVFAEMSKKDREKVAWRMMNAQPDLRRAIRDRMRRWLALLFVIAVFIDGVLALALKVTGTIKLEDMKEWLILALVPLTPGVTAAVTFWFPTRGPD